MYATGIIITVLFANTVIRRFVEFSNLKNSNHRRSLFGNETLFLVENVVIYLVLDMELEFGDLELGPRF